MADIRRRNIISINEGDVNPTKLRATEVSDTPVDSSEYVNRITYRTYFLISQNFSYSYRWIPRMTN